MSQKGCLQMLPIAFLLMLQLPMVVVSSDAFCKAVFTTPVRDCRKNPLRIGLPNYGLGIACYPLDHFPRSNGIAFVQARMNARIAVPRLIPSYLEIQLESAAEVFGLAANVTNNTAIAFSVEYSVSTARNIKLVTSISHSVYMEAGRRAIFDVSKGYKKFDLKTPFIAHVIQIHSWPLNGNLAPFQVEFYGCFLGAAFSPADVGVNTTRKLQFAKHQSLDNYSYISGYFVKFIDTIGTAVKELNGTQLSIEMRAPGDTSAYLFASYSDSSYLLISIIKFKVCDMIRNPVILGPSRITTGIKYNLFPSCSNPEQISSTQWYSGDYSRSSDMISIKYGEPGIYHWSARLSNAFYSATAYKTILACPVWVPDLKGLYQKTAGGKELVNAKFSFTVPIFLGDSNNASTNIFVTFNGSLLTTVPVHQTSRHGSRSQYTVTLPAMALGQYPVAISFNDSCHQPGFLQKTILVFEEVENPVIWVRYGDQATTRLTNGHTLWKAIKYEVTINLTRGYKHAECAFFVQKATYGWHSQKQDNTFVKEWNFNYDGTGYVGAWCQNVVSRADVPLIPVYFESFPVALSGISAYCSPEIISLHESVSIMIKIQTGTQFGCQVNISSLGVHFQVAYRNFSSSKSNLTKYSTFVLKNVIGSKIGLHGFAVECSNLHGSLRANGSLVIEIPVSGLSVSKPTEMLCVGESSLLLWSFTTGDPLSVEIKMGKNILFTGRHRNLSEGNLTVDSAHLRSFIANQVNITIFNNVSSMSTMKVISVLPLWKSLTLDVTSDIIMRPQENQPTRVNVSFLVSPNMNESFYRVIWTVNDVTVSTNSTQRFHYSFSSIGTYEISAVVIGCWNATVTRYLTIGTAVQDTRIPKTVPDCFICLGAKSGNVNSFVAYGSSNCKNAFPQTIEDTCQLYTPSSLALAFRITENGHYDLVRTGQNTGQVKASSRIIETEIKDCLPPTIEGRGLLLTASSAPVNLTNSLKHVLETIVSLNCSAIDYHISRTLFYLGKTSSSSVNGLQEYPFQMTNNLSESLAIQPFALKSGIYMMRVNASLKGAGSLVLSAASRDFYLNVTSRYPVATIINGSAAKALFPREYVLDGSDSQDPDQPISSSAMMTYIWICRDITSPAFDLTDNAAIQSLPVIDYSNAAPNSLGCFGQSQGILSREKSLKIHTLKMREDITYEIILVVSKDDIYGTKSAHFIQHLYVDFAVRPRVNITCSENCQRKVSPNRRLFLAGKCEGDGCVKPISYSWELYKIINNTEISVHLQRNQTATDTNQINFILKADVLEHAANYTLIFQGLKAYGIKGQKSYFIQVNDISVQGNCTVNPAHGVSLITNFNINCTGWSDTDGPLEYTFLAVSKYLSTTLCQGKNQSCEAQLPFEKESGLTRVAIAVSDPFGATARLERIVKVESPPVSLALMNNTLKDIANSVLMSSSSTAAATAIQKLSAFTAILNIQSEYEDNTNTTSDITNMDRIRLRNEAVNHMLSLNFPPVERLNTISPIAALLCANPNEVTASSAREITDALTSMEHVFPEEFKTMDFEEVMQSSKNFMMATSATMKVSSLNGAQQNTGNSSIVQSDTGWDVDQAVKIVSTLLNSTGNLQTQLIDKLIPGEDPLIIESSSLKTLVARRLLDEERPRERINTQIANAEVGLPALESLGPGISHHSLDLVMKVSKFNPFFWANSSKTVKSNVLDFKIAGSKVSNASEYIDLIVQRPNEAEPTWTRNTFKSSNTIYHHKITLQQGHSIHMEIMPLNACSSFDVYMKYESRPSRFDHDRKWSIPDFSNCSTNSRYNASEETCALYKNLTSQVSGNVSSNSTDCSKQENLVRERLRNFSNCTGQRNPFRIFVSNAELKQGAYFIGVSLSQETMKDAPSTQPPETYGNCSLSNHTSLGYHMLVYTANCVYWDQTKGWINRGCKVGPRTTWSQIHCKCNHLTSFASDFLVAPNPIDMSKVLDGFKNLKDNLSVFIFICVLIATYILLLVLLRRKDKADRNKLGVSVVAPSFPAHRFLIVFVTGARKGAGTTANVCVILNGDERKSDARVLKDSTRPVFQRDQINAFEVSYPKRLGNLQSMLVWHDNSGADPSWYISHIYVEDLETNERFKFLCMRWLAVGEEDGQIESVFSISDESDFESFSHLFTTKVARKCSDEHLWLSVVLNRPHSTFTRAQRMTCCLCLLVTTMLTSAMFFSFDGATASDKFTLRIGSLSIDFRGVIIGIEAGLIAIPVNAIILYLFRNSKPFPDRKTEAKDRQASKKNSQSKANSNAGLDKKNIDTEEETFVYEILIKPQDDSVKMLTKQFGSPETFFDTCPKRDSTEPAKQGYKITIPNDSYVSFNDRSNIPGEELTPRTKNDTGREAYRNRLPHYCLYISWLLSFAVVCSSLLVVLFYSMMWGNTKSKQWLLSVFTGFFQSMFVVQPFKLLIVSIIAAAILKMPENEEDILDAYKCAERHTRKERQKETAELSDFDYNAIQKLSEKQRKQARSYRLKEIRFHRLCRDVTLYMLFLIFLFLVAKGYRDPASYSMAQASGITGSAFESIKDVESTWYWIRHGLIVGLYENGWYNGKKAKNKLMPDKASFLVGPSRLRQIRIKPGTCQFPKEFIVGNNGSRTCNDYFSLSDEDRAQYDVGWKHFTGPKRKKREILNSQHSSPLVPGSNRSTRIRERRALRSGNFDIGDSSVENGDKQGHSLNLAAFIARNKIKTSPRNWKGKSTSQLNGFPYIGRFALYSGGGYAANLDSDVAMANDVTDSLHYRGWIDHLTRALFAEFSMYNANSNLFGTAFISIEFLPHGGAVSFGSVNVFNLYRYIGPNGKLVMASEVLVTLLLFCFIYRDMRRLYQQGLKYFKEFWNLVDTLVTILVFAMLILWFSRWYQADRNLLQLRKNPTSYVSFQYAAAADEAMVNCLGLIVFFSVLKLTQYLQFHPMILQLSSSLKESAGPIAGFILPFGVAHIAFGGLAYTAFGTSIKSFTSFLSTIEAQFLMMLGGSNYEELKECDPILGRAYFLVFVLFQVFFLFNLFIATLNESISGDSDGAAEDQAFIEFIMERFESAISRFSQTLGLQNTQQPSAVDAPIKKATKNIRTQKDAAMLKQAMINLDELFKSFDSKVERLSDITSSLERRNEIDATMMDVVADLLRERVI